MTGPSIAAATRASAEVKLRAIAAEEGIPWDPEMTFEAFALAVQAKRDERAEALRLATSHRVADR